MRLQYIIATLLLFLLGCQSTPDIVQETKQVPKYTAKQFFQTVNYSGGSFSADESQLLVSNNKTGIFNVYSLPVQGGVEKKLTQSKDRPMSAVTYFPKDDRFMYSSDGNGDELNHLYVVDQKGRKKDLTPGKGHKASFVGWNQAKTHFFVTSNERDPKYFDIYKYSAKNYKRRMIFKNTLGVYPAHLSRDERWLSLGKMNSNADSDIFLVDLKKKNTVPLLITNFKGPANFSSMTFTPDSKKLIYRTDSKGEFYEAWSYDLATKKHQPYLKEKWDIFYIYFSEKGNYQVTGINKDAKTVVKVKNLKTGQPLSLPAMKGNVVSVAISPSESKILIKVNSDTSPTNFYTTEINNMTPKKITNSLNPEITEEHLVAGHVVRYKSFDNLEIPSILFRPWKASTKTKVPAIVYVHGGPGGQSRKGYRAAVQHLVNHGYAVLMVNNRGSSGYGKTFNHLDDRKHGTDDLKDCIWGRKYLEKLPWVDSNNIAIMGGSYGGYMVAAALTFQPDAFDAGINIFGVTNWLRTLKNIPPWWEAMKDYLYTEVGDPNKDEQWLKAKSPLFHAEKIKKPFLVVQGKNDPRVLQAESDEIVNAARKNKVPVEYVLFKDEGHGFRKTENRIVASEKYLEFLNKHL